MTKSEDVARDNIEQVDELLRDSTPLAHATFFERFGLSPYKRLEFIRSLRNPPSRLDLEPTNGEREIPRVVHRMWLTNPDKPILPPKNYLDRISRHLADLPISFSCAFWSNSRVVLDYAQTRVRALATGSAGRFSFISSEKLSSDPAYNRVEQAIAARKFVLAGDIFKYLIVSQYGGIYGDMGIMFDERLTNLLLEHDVSLFVCGDVFFQPAFMAAKPLSSAFQTFRLLLAKPEILASVYIDPPNLGSPGDEIWVHGGLGFSAILMLFYDRSYSIVAVPPNRGLLHHESLSSWYVRGSNYGGVVLEDAKTTHFDLSALARYRAIGCEIDATWKGPPDSRTRTRAKILACLEEA